MKTIEAVATTSGSRETVWALLEHAPRWAEWGSDAPAQGLGDLVDSQDGARAALTFCPDFGPPELT